MAFENGTPNAVPFSQYKEHFEKKTKTKQILFFFIIFFTIFLGSNTVIIEVNQAGCH